MKNSFLLRRLRMKQINLLLAIDEYKTLNAAANFLNMSQPAASKMLHELEISLNTNLFKREGRGLLLNENGNCVLKYFKGLSGSLDAMTRELDNIKSDNIGQVKIGCIMAASPKILTDAIIKFKRKFKLVNIEIQTNSSDNLVNQLENGKLDFIIGRKLNLSNEEYKFIPLSDEELSIIININHPLISLINNKNRKMIFKELINYDWIFQPKGSLMRNLIEAEFLEHHLSIPKGLIETTSILTTTNLIKSTNMIGLIPKSIASYNNKYGLLKILPYKFNNKLADFGLIFKRDRPLNYKVQSFIEILTLTK